jgi:hypothetical protein
LDSREYTIAEAQSIIEWANILVIELDKAPFYELKKTLGEEHNKLLFTAYEQLKDKLHQDKITITQYCAYPECNPIFHVR